MALTLTSTPNASIEAREDLATRRESLGWAASRWQRFLHDRRAELGVLRDAEELVADQVTGQLAPRVLPPDAPEGHVDELGERVTVAVDHLGRGLYGHLYADPVAMDGGPKWARTMTDAVLATEGLEEVRALTVGDPDMAAIATASILRALAAQMPELFQAIDESGEDPEGEGEGEGEPEEGEGEGEGSGGGAGAAVDLEALAAALRAGMTRAAREVAEARSDLDGLLPGLGAGRTVHQSDPRRLQLLELIRGDRRLQQVLRIAGRIHRIADRIRRVPSPESRVEVVDVERGADLARVLPSELAGLRGARGHRLLALKGIADRSLLQRQTSGQERLGRGPMVVLIDASGSMSASLGEMERQAWAAAIGIAAVRTGVEQRRAVTIAVFDGRVRSSECWEVPAGDLAAGERAVLGLVGVQPNGGTVFDAPIRWGLDHGAERDRADLVLVTDGMGHVDPETVERLKKAQDRGLRLWGILAGEGGLPDVLNTFADGVTTITGRDGEDVANTVGQMGIT